MVKVPRNLGQKDAGQAKEMVTTGIKAWLYELRYIVVNNGNAFRYGYFTHSHDRCLCPPISYYYLSNGVPDPSASLKFILKINNKKDEQT